MGGVKALSFECDFSPADHGSPEERATTADLRIAVGDEVATCVDDSWARSVRERIRVSCYPLASWIAGSWWRLLHEAPSTQFEQALSWRMSHQVVAAGGGYLWPRLTFIPDGEGVDLECRASRRVLAEPLRFLSNFRTTVAAADVEKELAEFVSSVVARLDALGLPRTELHDLWGDVQAERADPATARYRALEAELGFDADEGPESLVLALTQLETGAGQAAVEEIANAVGVGRAKHLNPFDFVRAVDALARSPGMAATFDPTLGAAALGDRPSRPWQRGRDLATRLRGALALSSGPIKDDVLERLLGGDFLRPAAAGPLGLAVRSGAHEATLHFHRANPRGRRFEAARIVAEQMLAPPQDRWLATTDAATARQKAQRAFAAEFLAPIAELRERLQGDFSPDELENVADEYEVSSMTISSHLANHGLIAPDDVRGQ